MERHFRTFGGFPVIVVVPLLAISSLHVGCSRASPQDVSSLEALSISPELARSGTELTITLVASRPASADPRVRVGAEAATAVGHSRTDEGSVLYRYRYDVTGAEAEGDVPVVAVARSTPDGDEARLEGKVVFDFTPPTIRELKGPKSPTTETSASFTFSCSEDGCSFVCGLQSANAEVISEEAPCSSGSTYAGLVEGVYVFAVRAIDPAGNEGAYGFWPWTVTETSEPIEPKPHRRSGINLTSGGGTMTSVSHTLRIFVGGSAPMGSGISSEHGLELGPGVE